MPDLALTLEKLNEFMDLARQLKQSDILKWFLRKIVLGKDHGGADLCESGSVMVYHPEGNLHVFNDDNFLFEWGLLDEKRFKKMEFGTHEGIAGEAFSGGIVRYEPNVGKSDSYVNEGEPIKSMFCAPIKLPSRRREPRPFGVVSFHNGPDAPDFSPETRTAMALAVNCLAFALDLAARIPWNSVFIVHGRDSTALTKLELILEQRRVKTTVLAERDGGATALVEQLEKLLADCCAGFVLLTPDDEGRLTFGLSPPLPDHKRRARQNVIFESGWLVGLFRQHERICFLQTDPSLELPSDFGGLKWVPFDPEKPDIPAIEDVLSNWGINWTAPNRR